MGDEIAQQYGLSALEQQAMIEIGYVTRPKTRAASWIFGGIRPFKRFDGRTIQDVYQVLRMLRAKGIIHVVTEESLCEVQKRLDTFPALLRNEAGLPHLDFVDFTFFGGDLFDRVCQDIAPTQPLTVSHAWATSDHYEKLPARVVRRYGTIVASSHEAALKYLAWLVGTRGILSDLTFFAVREIGYIRERWWQPRELGKCYDFELRFEGPTEAENIRHLVTVIDGGRGGVWSSWKRMEDCLSERSRYTESEVSGAVATHWPELVQKLGWRDTLARKVREGLAKTKKPGASPSTPPAEPPHDEPWFD